MKTSTKALNGSRTLYLRVLWAVFIATLVLTGIRPADRFTWYLEVAPAVAGAVIVLAFWRRIPFTNLVCGLLCAHAVILCVGGHSTYAEMPLFNWIRDHFHLHRNYYDRFGHLAQGFVPAMAAREVLLRTSPLTRGKWLSFIVTNICLAFAAFYEFVEWWIALATGDSSTAFLGTQGDVWDTQWDMFMCLIGAIISQLLLNRVHDRQLRRAGVLEGAK